MKTWIALFRGINVGGKNRLPMAELRRGLESLGLENVQTYIQSGNVVFESSAKNTASLEKKIGDLIHNNYGFRPQLLMLDADELIAAVESNPFPEAITEPASLHLSFLAETAANPDWQALKDARAPSERFELIDRVFYLHAPDGIGRSRLAASAERYLGVVMTGRNYRTVDKLRAMVPTAGR